MPPFQSRCLHVVHTLPNRPLSYRFAAGSINVRALRYRLKVSVLVQTVILFTFTTAYSVCSLSTNITHFTSLNTQSYTCGLYDQIVAVLVAWLSNDGFTMVNRRLRAVIG